MSYYVNFTLSLIVTHLHLACINLGYCIHFNIKKSNFIIIFPVLPQANRGQAHRTLQRCLCSTPSDEFLSVLQGVFLSLIVRQVTKLFTTDSFQHFHLPESLQYTRDVMYSFPSKSLRYWSVLQLASNRLLPPFKYQVPSQHMRYQTPHHDHP